MLGSFISWFDSLPLVAILSVGVILILLEFLISKTLQDASKLKKWLLINMWQVFGVLLPVMWLLRASDNYVQVILLVAMMLLFGIYKPTRLPN